MGENHKSLGHSGSGIYAKKQSLRLQLGFKRVVKQHPPELESRLCSRGVADVGLNRHAFDPIISTSNLLVAKGGSHSRGLRVLVRI